MGRRTGGAYHRRIMRFAGDFFRFNRVVRSAATPTLTGLAFACLMLAGCATGDPHHFDQDKSEIALLKAGDTARDGGDLRSAVALYQQAAAIAPKDPAPWDRIGGALFQTGAYADAFTALKASDQRDPNNPVTERKLGKLALALGRPEQALGFFLAAQKQVGDDAQIWNGLGIAHDSLGQHTEAQSDYQKAMKLAPDNLAYRNNFGLSQTLAGNYPGAIATLTAVVADARATARYRQNLALAYGLAGDYVKASIAARKDIGDNASANNQKYYSLLRTMNDLDRTRAILGSEFGRSDAAGGETMTGPGGDSDKIPVEQHPLPR